jgi:hypothetical protein
MHTHIIGKISAFKFDRARGSIELALADGTTHVVGFSSSLSAEDVDTIGLTTVGDDVFGMARDEGHATPSIHHWNNRTLPQWLSTLKRAEAERLTGLRAGLEKVIQACLAELGWTVLLDCTAIASKMYDTAVGPRQALVYVQDFGPQEGVVRLMGDYQSEGRNCLSTTSVAIARFADKETIKALTQQFAAQADKVVGESYARRLLRA